MTKVVGSEEFISPELASLNINDTSQIRNFDLYKCDSFSLGLIFLLQLGLNIKSDYWKEKLLKIFDINNKRFKITLNSIKIFT